MLGRALNVFAGLLLVFPGPLSDLLALVLLFPPTRYLVRERIQSSMKISSPTGWMWRFGGFDGHEEHGPHGDDRSDPRGSSSPEKEGDGRGEFPGADRARDVDFQPSDPDSQNSRPGS